MNATISLERIGLNLATEYKAKELWSGQEQNVKGYMQVAVPSADVLLYKIINN